MRKRILLGLAVGVGCLVAVTTTASGAGPGPGLSQGWDGLAAGNERYVTVPAGASTSIQVINRNGGRVLRFMSIKGTWGIPLVAYDGTTAGFLPDGRTLLLAQPVYSGQGLRKHTSFTFVDVRKMKRLNTITLVGAYSFDALSPNGRYLYLIQYVSSEDLSEYRVRAYDLKAARGRGRRRCRGARSHGRRRAAGRTRCTVLRRRGHSSTRSTRATSRRSASTCHGRRRLIASSTTGSARTPTGIWSSAVRAGGR
ncbi:MAG: hypothetical protein E6G36_06865 [Actinobacteria bacterium]|nr:MAG: hypothetical protein E6G36_06865 [Actinomycetota bacterium]